MVHPHTTTPHKPPHQNNLITSTYTNTTKPTKRPRTPTQTKTINQIKDTSSTKIKNHSDTTPQITPTRHKRITTTHPISHSHSHITKPTPQQRFTYTNTLYDTTKVSLTPTLKHAIIPAIPSNCRVLKNDNMSTTFINMV